MSNARHNASDAKRAGFTIEEILNRTKIDRWFLVQIKEIVDFEEELAKSKELRVSMTLKAINALTRTTDRTRIC